MALSKPWWKIVLDLLAGLLSKQDLRRAGATSAQMDGVVTVSVPLGSGYDVEEDRRMKARQLEELCGTIISVAHYQPDSGVTYCNQAVREVAEALGCRDFPQNILANAMVDLMSSAYGWRTDTAERASEHAIRGGLAIAGKKYAVHGHVAVIAPQPCSYSGSWAAPVPILANVGTRNGFMKASEAFPVAGGEPAYYLWGEVA